MQTTHIDRYEYPFISADGGINHILTNSVDDLVLWVNDANKLPLLASAEVDGETLYLMFVDANGHTFARASYDSQAVISDDSSICGYIVWNKGNSEILKSALIANHPHPDCTVYVHPSACVFRNNPKMSIININNVDNGNSVVNVSKKDDCIVVTYDYNGYPSINIYEDSYGDISPITSIRFTAKDPKNDITISGINNHVWLKSEAECDIRVVTSDNITLTEISNDKL